MSNSQEKKQALVNKITHSELQAIYGISKQGAKGRLATIRSALKLKPGEILTVFSFCKVENFSVEEFDLMYARASK